MWTFGECDSATALWSYFSLKLTVNFVLLHRIFCYMPTISVIMTSAHAGILCYTLSSVMSSHLSVEQLA